MTEHRYPTRTLRKAYLRAAAGGAAALAIAVAAGGQPIVSVLCITIITLFGAYAWRTWRRGASTVVVDDEALRVTGSLARSLAWTQLTSVRLAYYTTRRDGEGGWMELTVRGPGSQIMVDSDIEDFEAIVARCRDAADARRIDLSPTTASNFDAVLSGAGSGGGRAGPLD